MDTKGSPEVAVQPKRKGRVKKFLLRFFMAVAVIILAAHFGWKYSGTSQWEKVAENKGVTLYAMKTPGSSVKKFKAVWKVRSKMSRLVAWVNDKDGDPKNRPMGLYDLRHIERRSAAFSITAYKQRFAPFLEPREFVLKTEFAQDPKSKALLYTVAAVPERIPANDCCVRISTMSNHWTLTPLPNGEVGMQWFADMDLGGAIPAVMQNKLMPAGMMTFAPKVEGFMEKPEYQSARYAWLQE